MIETGRIYISIGLILLSITLLFHLLAMGNPRWKVYEHRKKIERTLYIGIFRRCESRPVIGVITKTYPICDDNKYFFRKDQNCVQANNTYFRHEYCNEDNKPYNCDYSSITKGLISCTIIAACTLGISLILIFAHLLINQFKYKIHMYISVITIFLLCLGFIFILITLILLGATMSYDLYQYRYRLDCYLASLPSNSTDEYRRNVTNEANTDYDIRLDWSSILEIIALILSSLTIVSQIFYLFTTRRDRIG